MFKIFNSKERLDIYIENELIDSDIATLDTILSKSFKIVEFNIPHLHVLPAGFIKLLDKYIKSGIKIDIKVEKIRLSKYLHSLGFSVLLVSKNVDKNLQKKTSDKSIVALCGSYGSTKKFMDIVQNIKRDNLAIFIVQHIDKKSSTVFDKALCKVAGENVTYAKDFQKIERGWVYLAPPDKHLEVIDGRISLNSKEKVNFARPSISVSIGSFATFFRDKLIVVLSCGHGEDGVDALEEVLKRGCDVVVQDSSECEAKSIPLLAKNSKNYTFILNSKDIVQYINLIANNYDEVDKLIIYLFEAIRDRYEYNFLEYEFGYLKRRFETFMRIYNIQDAKRAVELILYDKNFFREFFLILSINVTEFFRDTKDYIALSRVIETLDKESSIKIWSVACSLGEEPYSLAIFLKKVGLLHKSLIYATDYNPIAIKEAKNALYSKKEYSTIKQKSEELDFLDNLTDEIEDYGNFFEISQNIKKRVLFFEYNLEKDTVFNEFNLIICKNILIYFKESLQDRLFKLVDNSLKIGGYLILGSSENITQKYKDRYVKIDIQSHIYRKVA